MEPVSYSVFSFTDLSATGADAATVEFLFKEHEEESNFSYKFRQDAQAVNQTSLNPENSWSVKRGTQVSPFLSKEETKNEALLHRTRSF